MREVNLKLKVMAFIKRNFPQAICWKLADQFNAGRPDLLILSRGKIIFVELKSDGKKARPLQEYILKQLQLQGAYTLCSDNYSKICIFLTRNI